MEPCFKAKSRAVRTCEQDVYQKWRKGRGSVLVVEVAGGEPHFGVTLGVWVVSDDL